MTKKPNCSTDSAGQRSDAITPIGETPVSECSHCSAEGHTKRRCPLGALPRCEAMAETPRGRRALDKQRRWKLANMAEWLASLPRWTWPAALVEVEALAARKQAATRHPKRRGVQIALPLSALDQQIDQLTRTLAAVEQKAAPRRKPDATVASAWKRPKGRA